MRLTPFVPSFAEMVAELDREELMLLLDLLFDEPPANRYNQRIINVYFNLILAECTARGYCL